MMILGTPLLAMPPVVDAEGFPGPEVDDWEPRLLATLLIVAGKESSEREVGVWEGLVIGACHEVDTVLALEVRKLLLLVVGRRLAAAAVLLTASQSPVPIRTVTTDGAIATGRVRVP